MGERGAGFPRPNAPLLLIGPCGLLVRYRLSVLVDPALLPCERRGSLLGVLAELRALGLQLLCLALQRPPLALQLRAGLEGRCGQLL